MKRSPALRNLIVNISPNQQVHFFITFKPNPYSVHTVPNNPRVLQSEVLNQLPCHWGWGGGVRWQGSGGCRAILELSNHVIKNILEPSIKIKERERETEKKAK